MKHPLTRALRGAGVDAADVAARLGVDPKTVQRWLQGRIPYPRHRASLVELTGWPSRDLWPGVDAPAAAQPTRDEVRVTYPQRCAVPADAWRRLFDSAQHDIAILAYSALFLAEDKAVLAVLREKARAGVRVRIALGDHDGLHIARRGIDEGIDDVMTARIHNALLLYRPLVDEPGIELRLHDTVLYNSIFLADDEVLVNAHVYGCPASHAPVLHLCRTNPYGMTATYVESFERVWNSASVARPPGRLVAPRGIVLVRAALDRDTDIRMASHL